jgi:hypothetical protein
VGCTGEERIDGLEGEVGLDRKKKRERVQVRV